jgi:hypothetical protein
LWPFLPVNAALETYLPVGTLFVPVIGWIEYLSRAIRERFLGVPVIASDESMARVEGVTQWQ